MLFLCCVFHKRRTPFVLSARNPGKEPILPRASRPPDAGASPKASPLLPWPRGPGAPRKPMRGPGAPPLRGSSSPPILQIPPWQSATAERLIPELFLPHAPRDPHTRRSNRQNRNSNQGNDVAQVLHIFQRMSIHPPIHLAELQCVQEVIQLAVVHLLRELDVVLQEPVPRQLGLLVDAAPSTSDGPAILSTTPGEPPRI